MTTGNTGGESDHKRPSIGFVGLGSMGLCLSRRLLARGWRVIGYDPAAAAMSAHVDAGGEQAASAGDVAARADMLVIALSSTSAYWSVIAEVAARPRAGGHGWVLDINTLSPEDKRTARDTLADADWRMLDCTVSGTPEMVERDHHSLYFSGEGRDAPEIAALSSDLSEKRFDMGEFGNAAVIKLIINQMVISHNVVAAEAMSLAVKAGMDPETVYRTVTASAGSSRIFEVRGRMMVDAAYPPETMYQLIVDKDARVIADMARELRHPIPMFALAVQAHTGALATRWANTDPGSLCAVMEDQSGIRRKA